VVRDIHKIIDLSSSPFPEVFLRTLGKDGKRLSYTVRCLLFGIALWITGLIVAYFSGAGPSFVAQYGFSTACVVVGITLWALIRFFKKIDDTFMKLDMGGTVPQEFFEWVRKKENSWFNAVGFYADAIGLAVIGFLFSYFILPSGQPFQKPPWIVNQVTFIYLVAWYTLIFFLAGGCISKVIAAIVITRHFCKVHVKSENLMPLNPDKTGGLGLLGKLCLELDMAVAIPSIVFIVYFVKGVTVFNAYTVAFLSMYTLLLGIVFFVPVTPAHDAMLDAKEQELQKISTLFKDFYSTISDRKKALDPKYLEGLRNLHFLYKEVNKMAVWPLDFRTIGRFLATSLLPWIGAITVEIMLKMQLILPS